MICKNVFNVILDSLNKKLEKNASTKLNNKN